MLHHRCLTYPEGQGRGKHQSALSLMYPVASFVFNVFLEILGPALENASPFIWVGMR